MMKSLFGGATMPMTTAPADSDSPKAVQSLSRHALVDRFGIDFDGAAILLGPVARQFHGIAGSSPRVGIRTFLECYEPLARPGLAELIEKFADEGQPFHFSARLLASPGAYVHGSIATWDACRDKGGWTGMLVMSHDQHGLPLSGTAN